MSRANKNQAAQRKFADIAEAYEILRDGTTRQLYDHARRVRATHDSSAAIGIESDDWATATTEGDWWYYDGDGGTGSFGSSFEGVFGFGGKMDFDQGGEPYGGGSDVEIGGESGGNTGAGMRGGPFKFRASDPFELFEVHRVEIAPGVLWEAVVESCIKLSFVVATVMIVLLDTFMINIVLRPESKEELLSFLL